MFLKQISLHNFKCLENIELSFSKTESQNRKLTLILGENGTGKSNLLKAIALITAGSNALGQLLGDSDTWIRNGKTTCVIRAVLETKSGEERHVELSINKGDSLSTVVQSNIEAFHLIDSALEKAERNYFVAAYGASRRLSEQTSISEKETPRRFNNIKNLFFNQYTLNPLTAWVIDLDYSEGEKGLRLIKDTLNDFLPGIKFYGIDKQRKQVLFETVDGLVSLSQLSDGYQNMAAWIGDLLYRITQNFGDYKKPLEARGLLLIDEVDLHLHPTWQRHLLDFISKKLPNFQVVATTHSPLTAQQADEGELFALKRTDGLEPKIEIIPFLGSPRKLLVNQLLMTPAFGLDTDESLEVEETKKSYDRLTAGNKRLTAGEEKELRAVTKKLRQSLPQRDMPAASKKEIDLLKKIEDHLGIN